MDLARLQFEITGEFDQFALVEYSVKDLLRLNNRAADSECSQHLPDSSLGNLDTDNSLSIVGADTHDEQAINLFGLQSPPQRNDRTGDNMYFSRLDFRRPGVLLCPPLL